MTVTLDEVKARIDAAVQEDPEKGIFRGRREAFTDPDIFELEMKYIFEGNWIYLAHESQLPNNNDYLTTYMGRQPIVITRDKTGELHALINACSHRGAMLCHRKKDNRSTFTGAGRQDAQVLAEPLPVSNVYIMDQWRAGTT